MKTIKELQKEKNIAVDARKKVMENFDFVKSDSFQDWEDAIEPHNEKISRLSFLIDSQTDVEWRELPNYGTLMTIEDWLENVTGGGFIDYDGSGNYSDGKRMSNKSVSPSDVDSDQIMKNKEFTHIIWFNR
jgi:hypothetical protein